MFKYDENLTFHFSDIEETDVFLVSVHDKRTDYWVRTVIPNHGKQTASLSAFAGARYSRSSDSIEYIFKEVKEAGGNAQEKLANIFRKYGHASVADMAQLFVYIENIPQIYAAKFFNETSIGGGQERSTRYQDFGNLKIHNLKDITNTKNLENYEEINKKFRELQEYSLEKYNHYVDVLTNKYKEIYKPDPTKKAHTSALEARVFDSARYFLQCGLGNRTSLGWITSAREWSRLISFFKSRGEKRLQYMAEQLEALLAPEHDFAEKIGYTPEAPDLIRHTTADETTENTLKELKKYLEKQEFEKNAIHNDKRLFTPVETDLYTEEYDAGTKIITQNILTLYPNIDEKWLLSWLQELSTEKKKKLSKVLITGFNHHQQMGNQYRVNTNSFVLHCSIAEARDLNRHRAWGRFTPVISTENYLDLLPGRYALPAYLYENSELRETRKEFELDLLGYYKKLDNFIDLIRNTSLEKDFILELLPFAHITKMWMHGSPKEISYLTKLRVRPGGHINYRLLAYQMAKKTAENNPFLSTLELEEKPDPTSCEEFFDRS